MPRSAAPAVLLLLADSRPLFADPPLPVIDAYRGARAAYLGASNLDVPAYYMLFRSAMARLGITDTRHIPAAPTAGDVDFLNNADIVILSGGDPVVGWLAFQDAGLDRAIENARDRGTAVVGVSAGAIQMGAGWIGDDGRWHPFFGWLPYIIDVHDESNDWQRLTNSVHAAPRPTDGIGVPTGGWALYRDGSLDAPDTRLFKRAREDR